MQELLGLALEHLHHSCYSTDCHRSQRESLPVGTAAEMGLVPTTCSVGEGPARAMEQCVVSYCTQKLLINYNFN